MMSAKNIEKLIKRVRYKAGAEMHERTLKDALEAQAESRKVEWASAHSNIWRTIMKSNITKLATAAVIIIAAMVSINHFEGSIDGSSVVFAEVLKKIQEANSAMWHEQRIMTFDGEEISFHSDVVRYYSSEYGGREDMYNREEALLHQVYWLTKENACIKVVPLLKRYKRDELAEAERAVWGQTSVEAIVELVKLEKPTKLGCQRIDGREAEGFEIRDSKIAAALSPVTFDSLVARFWIDVETSLPVRYEAELVTSDRYVTFLTGVKALKVKVIADEPRWDIGLEPSFFEPNIPPDYTPIEY